MKKNKKCKQAWALLFLIVVVLCGCSAQEPVFTDVQEMVSGEENDWQDDVFMPDEGNAAAGTGGHDEMLPVIVHICGAVVSPGVYELSQGSRIVDAVNMAGGFGENADDSYVNLADVLSDGEQIFIPTCEEAQLLKNSSQEHGESSGKVNINTADKALLCSLPGIGDSRAADIIAYRQEHGGFAAIEDIMRVSGIKEGSFQKIKELIVVK